MRVDHGQPLSFVFEKQALRNVPGVVCIFDTAAVQKREGACPEERGTAVRPMSALEHVNSLISRQTHFERLEHRGFDFLQTEDVDIERAGVRYERWDSPGRIQKAGWSPRVERGTDIGGGERIPGRHGERHSDSL